MHSYTKEIIEDYLNNCNKIDANKLKTMGEWAKQHNEIKLTIKCYLELLNHETLNSSLCFLHNELGICYMALNEVNKSIQHFKNILKLGGHLPDVYNNLIICYGKVKQYKNAEVYAIKSLELLQNDFIYTILGDLYFYMKEYEKSIHFYLKIDNQESKIKYNLSFPYLAKKIFSRGFELYESRLASNGICEQTNLITRVKIPGISYWDGLLPCQHLLVIYEQGIGDNILYYRFLLMCAQLYPHMKVTYFCKHSVSHLFKNILNNVNIISDSNEVNLKIYQYKTYIMSLPFLLRVRSISSNIYNYIHTNESITKKWNTILNTKQYKIGFTYKGLLNSFIEKNIPLSYFENIANMENVKLICLHKQDEIKEEINAISFKEKIYHYDIDKKKAFEDTIGILQNLDLLVTIDTAIVHLAGVLNIPTLLLLGYGSDWRWFNCDECLWFKNISILRNKENNELYNIMPKVETFITSHIANR